MARNMVRNCKITSTMLGYEDHGILTCMLNLNGDTWGVGFGGYSLDSYDEERKERFASAEGFKAILAILETLELSSWEKLPGTFIRAEMNDDGRCERIGHLMKEKWFSFKDFFKAA